MGQIQIENAYYREMMEREKKMSNQDQPVETPDVIFDDDKKEHLRALATMLNQLNANEAAYLMDSLDQGE